jgi:hypothetical protein
MDGLPPDVDPLLDAPATYEPAIGTGVFSYATGHRGVVDEVERAKNRTKSRVRARVGQPTMTDRVAARVHRIGSARAPSP